MHLRSIVSIVSFRHAFGMEMDAFSLILPYSDVATRVATLPEGPPFSQRSDGGKIALK